jgi:hypothetical protein
VRTRPCDGVTARARLAKGTQFYSAAETIRELADSEEDVGDAFVTLCVHAGIAAADAICCTALGEHAQGDNHTDAVALLQRVRPDGRGLGSALGVLLALKSRAGYSAQPVSADMRKRAQRAAEKLVDAASARVTR